MSRSPFATLRRRLALAGARPAEAPVDRAGGRAEGATFRPSVLLEPSMRHHAVGAPRPWTEDIAFLDGTQRVELVARVGTAPLVAAVIRAGARLRRARRLGAAVQAERRIAVARPDVLDALDGVLEGYEPTPLERDEPPHPIRDLDLAHGAVDRARAALERQVAATFRRAHEEWLVLDGALADHPELATDPRAVGVVKSHAALPFEGDDLLTYLTLPVGHRSALFRLSSHHGVAVASWALRLHDPAGRDLFHGLVRVETALATATPEHADLLSRHLLAERAPLADDPRADRLLYGIHDVERALRAGGR